jgi:hypothetical protein
VISGFFKGRQMRELNDRALTALRKITEQARSWHDFHHGDTIVQCDEICECLPECEAVLAEQGKERPITEEWLREAGFKWHQLDRQYEKQWLLWLGDVVFWREGGFRFMGGEDLGIEVSQSSDHWKCWLRSDYAHRYSRFIFVRDLHFQHELIALIETITSQTFDPRNNLYGTMHIPKHAAKIREEDKRREKRLDARRLQPNWREIEKDDSRGRPLPEHLQAAEDTRLKKKTPGEN